MGHKQSKVVVISSKPEGKGEKRKKLHTRRSLVASTNGISETWRFTGGGKRIHNLRNSKLLGPIADEEVERLQRQHRLFKRIWQNNYSAPVESLLNTGARVLDVGCGPGSWTIEMAEAYQKSTFTGVDFAPIFPQEKKPENVKFLQANILDGLPFLDDTFDFIHMRLLVTAFTVTEWEQNVIPELIRVTRNGGWIEFMESDVQYYNEGPTTARLTAALMTFMKSRKITVPLNFHIPQTMEANDKIMKGVQTEEKSCFVGKWAGELGQMAVDDITKGWLAVKTPMSKVMKVKSREYSDIVSKFAEEVEQNKTYFKTWRFFGQKGVTTSDFDGTTSSSWEQ